MISFLLKTVAAVKKMAFGDVSYKKPREKNLAKNKFFGKKSILLRRVIFWVCGLMVLCFIPVLKNFDTDSFNIKTKNNELALNFFDEGEKILNFFKNREVEEVDDWVNFVSDDNKFSLWFPGDPMFESKKLFIPGINKTLNFSEYNLEKDKEVYSVSYMKFSSIYKLAGSNTILKKCFDCGLDMDKRKPISVEKRFSRHQGKYSSLDFSIKYKDEEIIGRFIIVKNTFYKVVVSHPNSNSKDHELFLNSFQVHSV